MVLLVDRLTTYTVNFLEAKIAFFALFLTVTKAGKESNLLKTECKLTHCWTCALGGETTRVLLADGKITGEHDLHIAQWLGNSGQIFTLQIF